MAPRTLGTRGPAATAPQQQPQPAAHQPQQPGHRPAAAQAGPPRGGSGLPPVPAGWTPHAGGSGFTKRKDKEWEEDHPLKDGDYEFDVYVTKIVEWAAGGCTVTLRVSDWDRESNRSGPHHSRPLRWDQQPRKSLMSRLSDPSDEKARTAYGNWRHDLVNCYAGVGHPEETWPRTGEGDDLRVWPPHDRFFVQVIGGVAVPVMLHAKVRAWSMRGDGGRFATPFHGLDVQALSVIRTADGRPFQAMLPREVPPAVAAMWAWRVAEERTIGDNLAQVAVLDKDSISFPHNGLPTYKDL